MLSGSYQINYVPLEPGSKRGFGVALGLLSDKLIAKNGWLWLPFGVALGLLSDKLLTPMTANTTGSGLLSGSYQINYRGEGLGLLPRSGLLSGSYQINCSPTACKSSFCSGLLSGSYQINSKAARRAGYCRSGLLSGSYQIN